MNNPVIVKPYIIKETLVAMVFNAVFSALFTWVAFSGDILIYDNQILFDALPQSFFVAFFSVFVPTVLTRKRLARGGLPTLSERRYLLPYHAFLRAVVLAVIVALLGFLFHYVFFLIIAIEPVSFTSFLIYKSLYGVALAVLITPWVLTLTLSEPVTAK